VISSLISSRRWLFLKFTNSLFYCTKNCDLCLDSNVKVSLAIILGLTFVYKLLYYLMFSEKVCDMIFISLVFPLEIFPYEALLGDKEWTDDVAADLFLR
jgi:hypothetical protein